MIHMAHKMIRTIRTDGKYILLSYYEVGMLKSTFTNEIMIQFHLIPCFISEFLL